MGSDSHRDTKAQRNSNIRVLPHEARRPVMVEREHPDVLVIEGVRYAGDVFRTLAFPGPGDYLYAVRRDGDVVIMTTIHTVEEAEAFFAEVAG